MRLSLFLGLLFLGACASDRGAVDELQLVRSRASFDLNCDESKVAVQSSNDGLFMAKGCKREGTYRIQCSLGPCQAVNAN